jgi:hypothetical protein
LLAGDARGDPRRVFVPRVPLQLGFGTEAAAWESYTSRMVMFLS